MKLSIFIILLLNTSLAFSHDIEITYFLKSQHFAEKMNDGNDFNANHNFIGVEYRDGKNGYSVSSFTNSYYKQSYLIDYARYWQPMDNIEASVRIGVASGYDGDFECTSSGTNVKICPVVSVVVAYTGINNVIPKLSLIPGAFTLSFSARF